MNKLFCVTLVCMLVVASARILPQEQWSPEIGEVGSSARGPELVPHQRQKRAYYFRRFWSCPIGYVRSAAAICVECGEYEMITGVPCDSAL